MYSPELGQMLTAQASEKGCIYDISRPDEGVASGDLLELVDFHRSAASIGSAAALGTRVFKESIMAVTADGPDSAKSIDTDTTRDPFSHVWRLPGSPNGLTVWTSPSIHMRLQDFYIEAQALKDYYDALTEQDRLRVFAKKGRLVVRDVIYDDGVIE
jgi:hypothetical protein